VVSATHPAAIAVDELLAQCNVVRTRRSGPGGQHRNKVETAVVITHRPTGCQGQASERRSQDLNRQAAIQRLRVKLATQVRMPLLAECPPARCGSRVPADGNRR
jgi:protein subunit release factor B